MAVIQNARKARKRERINAWCGFLLFSAVFVGVVAVVWWLCIVRQANSILSKEAPELFAFLEDLPLSTILEQQGEKALFTSADQLNAHPELFRDPYRTDLENKGPFLIVVDDFYPDPDVVRRTALAQEFYHYKPPLAEQVGQDIANEYADSTPQWLSSALLRYHGKTVNIPHPGYRYADRDVIEAIAKILPDDDTIKMDTTWSESGDWWNGAFHLQFKTANTYRVIHHHYRDGDVVPIGWSGVVYLSPNPSNEQQGTTIWRENKSGRCTASKGNKYETDPDKFTLALSVENKYNRLVLFRENVLHRAASGFGDVPGNARLTQTFFFQIKERTTA